MNVRRAIVPLLLAGLAAITLANCGANEKRTLLTPTGIRPSEDTRTGGLFGFVRHDSTLYSDLSGAPYPPTLVTLLRGSEILGTDSVSGEVRGFRFEGLATGNYTVVARSHAFRPALVGPILVRDIVLDAGDLRMPAAPESVGGVRYVVGTMPGFSLDDIPFGSMVMEQNTPGIDSHPDTDPSTDILTIPAGTYRFKFVTDESSSPGNLIGWGGDSSVTLVAPVTDSPVRFTSDAATEIKVTFPTTDIYEFRLDHRRLTFSVRPMSAPPAAVAVRGRSARPTR